MPIVSDKFNWHKYQEMYGIFLIPHIRHKRNKRERIRFLEIGLGCMMGYGPGASALLWKSLLGENDDLWFAEFNGTCVEEERSKSDKLDGLHIVVGDQSDKQIVAGWVKEISSGGPLDIIIDDGSHMNDGICTSFRGLWEILAPGGLYFVEDLQVNVGTNDEYGHMFLDYVRTWTAQLMLGWAYGYDPQVNPEFTPPKGLKWIMCQRESCVLAKCELNDVAKCDL